MGLAAGVYVYIGYNDLHLQLQQEFSLLIAHSLLGVYMSHAASESICNYKWPAR